MEKSWAMVFLGVRIRSLVLWNVIGISILGVVGWYLNKDSPCGEVSIPFIVIFLGLLTAFIPLPLIRRGTREKGVIIRPIVQNSLVTLPWKDIILLVPLLILFSLGASHIYQLILLLLNPIQGAAFLASYQGATTGLTSADVATRVITFINIIIAAPLMEELVFRGILYHRLRVHGWGWLAVVLPNLFFGSQHILDPLGAAVFGLLMSFLFIKTGNILFPMVIHFVNNLIAAAPSLVWRNVVKPDIYTLEIYVKDLPLNVSVFALSLIGLIYYFWKYKPLGSQLNLSAEEAHLLGVEFREKRSAPSEAWRY